MTDDKKIVSGKRYKIRISHILIFLLLIIAAAFVFFRYNTKRELDKRIKAIRAAGYPVTLEELDQWYSIPDSSQNAADIILSASGYYNNDQNDSEILPFINYKEIESRSESLSEEVLSQSSRFFTKNKQCLDLLYTVKNYKYCRYPINLNDGFYTILPHVSEINKFTRLLQLNAIYNSECNNPESVIDSIEAMICVSHTLYMEPLNISQLVRSSLSGRVYKTLELILNRMKFNEEELLRLNELLKGNDEFSGLARGIIGERCITLDVLKNILTFDREFVGIDLPPVFILEAYKALGLIDREAVMFIDLQKEHLGVLNLPLHERLKASKVLDSKIKEIKEKSLVLKSFIGELYRVVEIDLRNSAGLINARTAIAVERYRLNNNKMPDSLSNLVPDYLDSIPLDLFDRKELRYKKLDKGFVVYSIGEDLIDNNGKERKKSGDISDITFIIEK